MTTNASIRFAANDIQLEGLDVDVTLTPDWLDAALSGTNVRAHRDGAEGGRVRGRLSRSGQQDIVVRAHVRAEVEASCVRCLTPSHLSVDAELSLLLQPQSRADTRRARAHDGEYEFTAHEADVDVYDGETVVLDDFVREAILLEVPAFPLCRESCPGLLQGDRNVEEPVDPRLAPLDAFREKRDGPVTVDKLVAAAKERAAVMGRKPMHSSHRTARKKRS